MRLSVFLLASIATVVASGEAASEVLKSRRSEVPKVVESGQAAADSFVGANKRFLRVRGEDNDNEEERGFLTSWLSKSKSSKKSESAMILTNEQALKSLAKAQSSKNLPSSNLENALVKSKSMSAKPSDMEKRQQIALMTAMRTKAQRENGNANKGKDKIVDEKKDVSKVQDKVVDEKKYVSPYMFFKENELGKRSRTDPKWREYNALKEALMKSNPEKYGIPRKKKLPDELKAKLTKELATST